MLSFIALAIVLKVDTGSSLQKCGLNVRLDLFDTGLTINFVCLILFALCKQGAGHFNAGLMLSFVGLTFYALWM